MPGSAACVRPLRATTGALLAGRPALYFQVRAVTGLIGTSPKARRVSNIKDGVTSTRLVSEHCSGSSKTASWALRTSFLS